MKSLKLKTGMTCILNNDGTWSCLAKVHNKEIEDQLEQTLNSLTVDCLETLSPADGDPMTLVLNWIGKLTEAVEVNNDYVPSGKFDPMVVN